MAEGSVKYLETGTFHDASQAFKTGIQTYNDIKNDVVSATSTLFWNWQGEGKTQFEKDYNTIFRQLTDIGDILYELYDALAEAEALYIQADEEAAKMLMVEG